MDIHMSYIATGSSSSCQKLASPCKWMSTKYGTDVTVPPQSSLLPEGVTARLHHKKMMVWWSPNVRLGRHPWGGSMGSSGFFHGHQPEHPLRMGEDCRQCVVGMDVFVDKMANRIMYIWWRDRCLSPYIPSDSRLDDYHDCLQNWVIVTRPLGYEMSMHPSM